MLGQPLGEIERRGPADIVREVAVHLGGTPDRPWLGVGLLQFQDQRHQRFGDEAAAENAEMAALVRPGAEGIRLLHGHAGLVTGFVAVAQPRSRAARTKARICIRVFVARAALDAGGNIDAGSTGDAQGFADVAGIEPAREHERHTGIEILQKAPFERFAEAARPRRFARRPRIKQQSIRDRDIVRDQRKIAFPLDRDRFHDRQAKPPPKRSNTRRRLLAVKLQQIRLQRRNDRIKQRIVGIDGERDFLRAAAHARAEHPRRIDCQMARRRRKEHKADHVGARLERDIESFRRREAADFDN